MNLNASSSINRSFQQLKAAILRYKTPIFILYMVVIFATILFFLSRVPVLKAIEIPPDKFSALDEAVLEKTQDGIKLVSTDGFHGAFMDSRSIILPAGDFVFTVNYRSTGNNQVNFQANNDIYQEVTLPSWETSIDIPVHLDLPSDNAKLRFIYYEGDFELLGVRCSSDKFLYTDPFIQAGLLLLYAVVVIFFYLNRKKYSLTLYHAFLLLLFSFFSFVTIPYLAMVDNGLYGSVDILFHLSRVEGVRDALIERQFPAVIYPYWANEYGVIGTIYPNFFLYFPAALRLLGDSPEGMYKHMTYIINFFMLTSVYWSAIYISKSRKTALIAVFLFGYSACHLNAVGVENYTLGTGIAYIFVFLVLAGIYSLFVDEKPKWPLLVIGMSGTINSHILSAVFSTLLIAVVCIAEHKKLFGEERRILPLLKAVGVSLLINAGTIYMFLDGLFSNKLNTQNLEWEVFTTDTLSFGDLFSTAFGISAVISFILVLLYLLYPDQNGPGYRLVKIIWILDLVLFSFATKLYPWEKMVEMPVITDIIHYVQYPQRLNYIITPTMAICVAYALFHGRKFASHHLKSSIVIFMFILLAFHKYHDSIEIYSDPVKMPLTITDKILGEVYATPAHADYLPKGVTREWYSTPFPILSDDSRAAITFYTKQGTRFHADYICREEGQYIDVPTFYYKGYHCVDTRGEELPIKISEQGKIRVPLNASSSPESIDVYYEAPVAYRLLCIFSLICAVIFGLWLAKKTLSQPSFSAKAVMASEIFIC